MKRVFIIVIIIAVVASFIGTGYFLYKKSVKPAEVYETEKPFKTDITKKTVATGSINPRKEVELKSQVSGVIEKLYVEPGDIVRRGDLIAKIRIIPNVVALNRADADLKEAIINFRNSEIEKVRQFKLFEEKVISEFEYNQFLLSFNLSKQQLDAAENNLELIKEGASKKSGAVSNQVRSTVDGMVLDTPFKEGNYIIETNTFNDGSTIASVANMTEMIFEGKVDESEVGKLKVGMELKLDVGALDDDDYNASLEYISPKGVEEEGAIQFEIRASITLQKGTFLRAGYSANADIVLDYKEDVLALKESMLIFDDDDKIYVEVMIAEQQFEKREVITGISDGINIEIVEGIKDTEEVKKI